MKNKLEEPKVEFIDIDVIDIVTTSWNCGSESCNLQGCDDHDW